tara:strand:+ start:48 stop:1340 length:1293 start_codon:yes stop_codon:yes gene_type:complete
MAFDPFSLATALTALFLVPLVNDLSGGRIGNALSQRGFKSNYQLSLDKYNKEQKLNKDTFNRNQSFANINRRLRGGGSGRSVTTRDGVLSFLGDPSRKLDDAPDIVEQNQSVLRGVETLGGFFPFLNTQQPNIDNQKIVDSGFLGVRLEIDKINRNIDAIAAALGQSAIFEEKYRKDMIDAMRKDLAEKGKDRSETRSERSIFNLITRPVEQVQKRFGNLAKELQNALLLSVGLESAAAMADLFDGDPTSSDGGGDDNKKPPGSDNKNTPQVGDYYRGKDRKYYVLQSDGSFKKTSHVRPKTGKQFKKEDFVPVIEGLKKGENTNLEASGFDDDLGIDGKEVSSLSIDGSSENNNSFTNNAFSPSQTIAMDTSGLEGRDRFTYIDMTTKNTTENLDAQNGGSGSQFDDSILEGDAGRGPGYEIFLSGAVV